MSSDIYVSTTFFRERSLKKALELCREHSISNLEIGSTHFYETTYDYVSDYSFNYLVHNYFPVPKTPLIFNIASNDAEIRRHTIQNIKKSIDFCCDIGAKLYTFHPGFLGDPLAESTSKNDYDFIWDENEVTSAAQSSHLLMLRSLEEIVNYAKKRGLPVAIETEGSVAKKYRLLLQRPEEYVPIIESFSPNELGVNLNIGHLVLAKHAFGFSIGTFVDLLADRIVAMELSDNDKKTDQHLPLTKDGWYWGLIFDNRFKAAYKILEFRNVPIEIIINNIKLLNEKRAKFV